MGGAVTASLTASPKTGTAGCKLAQPPLFESVY
jgi:hypothetical protein